MKKIINMAFFYSIFGLVSGLFYREFTKINDFEGVTVLSGLHTHILTMGMLFMLIILILVRLFPLLDNKWFKRFWPLYNGSFIGVIVMLSVRGTVQVLVEEPSSMMDGMIAGIAGLTHIALTVAIFMFFMALKGSISGVEK